MWNVLSASLYREGLYEFDVQLGVFGEADYEIVGKI